MRATPSPGAVELAEFRRSNAGIYAPHMRAITDAAPPAAGQAPNMNSNRGTETGGRASRQVTRRMGAASDLRSLVIGLCLGGATIAGYADAPGAAAARTTPARTVAAVTIHVTVSSPTHTPKVNVPWPVKVTVTNAKGKPVAATLTMQVLFSGQPVGKIDNGATYHFVGTWQERKGNKITWPASSKGEPLTLQFIVKAQGVTVRKNWAITVS